MIGTVIMDVSEGEMKSALQYYFNSELFFSKHKVKVTSVRQRSNGRFVIDFDGQPEVQRVPLVAATAAAGGGE